MIDASAIQETLLTTYVQDYNDRRTEFQIGRASRVASTLAATLESGAEESAIRGIIMAEYPGIRKPQELAKQVMIHRYPTR